MSVPDVEDAGFEEEEHNGIKMKSMTIGIILVQMNHGHP